LSKLISIKVQQWGPAHDDLMSSPEITKILQELPEESRLEVEKHLRAYVSALGGAITALSSFKSSSERPGSKNG